MQRSLIHFTFKTYYDVPVWLYLVLVLKFFFYYIYTIYPCKQLVSVIVSGMKWTMNYEYKKTGIVAYRAQSIGVKSAPCGKKDHGIYNTHICKVEE